MNEVERLAKQAMTTFAGNAHRGVVAGLAVADGYAVIVVGPRDDLAHVTAASGPVMADGALGPEQGAKVKAGKVKGEMAKLLKEAEAAAVGAAVASTGLEA